MKYVDEFRDARLIKKALAEIRELAQSSRHYRIMEICGGHTHSIFRFGLHGLLPSNVELIHGPGCPVCVLPMGRIDDGLALANDALKIARQNPERKVVFFAIGFETTAPSTALTLMHARALGIDNFAVFCNHITIAPAIRAILDSPDIKLDGFIGPGHVSTVIGCRPYEFIARDYDSPIAVAGFEPVDILEAMVMVLRQLKGGIAKVECQYKRAVPWDGNAVALQAMDEVFEERPHFEWRGLGSIAQSALKIRREYAAWDAEQTMPIPGVCVADPQAAQCSDVLRGLLKPQQCRLFGKECTPERPIGALMVSSEGACAAHYKYGRHEPDVVTLQ